MREEESMNVVDQDDLDEGISNVPHNSHVRKRYTTLAESNKK
jgi:hypothetical protein